MPIYGFKEKELHRTSPDVPIKYWTDTGEVDPDTGKPILENNWIEMLGPKPQDGKNYEAQPSCTWLEVTSIEDARLVKQAEVVSYGDIQDQKPYEYPAESGVFWKVTDAVIKTLGACGGLASEDLIPRPDGKWSTIDPFIQQVFTVAEFQAMYDYAYQIPSDNYNVALAHCEAIGKATTLQAVADYDYSAGWR